MDGQEPCVTSSAQQLRVVQQLLWEVISQALYPAERDEIRRALGSSLIDENETLFAEAGALAEIMGDVQINTAALLQRQQICSNPQRSLVETEIRLLIERLHCSALNTPFGSAVVRERDPGALLPKASRKDKAVLDYVATQAQIAENGGRPPTGSLPPRPPTSLSASSSSRPGTTSSRPPTSLSATAAFSRPGTASPTALPNGAPGSRPSTASSAASSAATRYTDAPSVVAGVADRLSIATIDSVKETLRGALADERAALLEDVEYLQGLLEAEADLQSRAAAPVPSISELKEYSTRLAAVVEQEEARVEHEVRVSAMFAAADSSGSKAGRLRGMVDASRRPPSSGGVPMGVAPVAAPATLSPLVAPPPPGARQSVQTLVVHGGGGSGGGSGGGDDLGPPPPMRRSAGSASEAAAAAGLAAAGPGVSAAAPPSPLAAKPPLASPSSSSSASASTASLSTSADGGLAARGPPLGAIRRPGSGGPTPGTADASPLPPLIPPASPMRGPSGSGPLPSLRTPTSSSMQASAAATTSALAGGPGEVLAQSSSSFTAGSGSGSGIGGVGARGDANGLLGASSSGRLQPPSPGRPLPAPLGRSPGAAGTSTSAAATGSGTAGMRPHTLPHGHPASPSHRESHGVLGTASVAGARSSPATRTAAHTGAPHGAASPSPVSKSRTGVAGAAGPSSTAGGTAAARLRTGTGSGTGTGTSAGASTASPGPGSTSRSLLPRSGSVGTASTPNKDRLGVGSHAGTSGTRTPGAAPASPALGRISAPRAGSATGNGSAPTPASPARASSASAAGAGGAASASSAAAAAASSPSAGAAVAARLGAEAEAAPSAAIASGPSVQPRALLGSKQSMAEKLEEELDALKGGVAAILERYNVQRPSTPSGGSGSGSGTGTGTGGR